MTPSLIKESQLIINKALMIQLTLLIACLMS